MIGAGVIGLSCALELKRRGADVAVYDKGVELGAGVTIRAAGMLSVGFDWGLGDEAPALGQFALEAGRLWPDFAARVQRDGGGSIEFSREGAIALARTATEQGWLEKLALACQVRGLPAQLMSPADVRRTDKAVSWDIRGGLLLPEDRQVEAPMLLQRLGAAAARMGVGLKLGRAVERIAAGEVFQLPDGEKFDRVVLATGAGAQPKFIGRGGEAIPLGLPDIVPVKGQMLALEHIDGAPRHVLHARDVYIAPKARWVLVGATVERGSSDTHVDGKLHRLREAAGALAPALERAQEVSSWAGVRPGTPDDAPVIGETALPGVHAALGHYRNGVLFAPATAEAVAGLILDGRRPSLAAAFDPARFRGGFDPRQFGN